MPSNLVAVDHPPEFDVYPNERLLSAPPYPEFKLYPLQGLRPPVAARDHRGADVLATFCKRSTTSGTTGLTDSIYTAMPKTMC